MDVQALLIQLAAGAVGGNAAGALLKKLNLGVIGNTIAGLIGGAGGAQLLEMINGVDVAGLGAQIAAAGGGGAIVLVIVGAIKNMLSGKK